MTTQEKLSPFIIEARDATEAVGMFLQMYCDFGTTRDKQIVEAVKLYVRSLIERHQELALELAAKSASGHDSGGTTYSLHSPEPLVAYLREIIAFGDIRILDEATTMTSTFDHKYHVLRVSLDAVLFGGRVIWQRTNFAGS